MFFTSICLYKGVFKYNISAFGVVGCLAELVDAAYPPRVGGTEAKCLCIRARLIHYYNGLIILPKHKQYIDITFKIHLHSPTMKTDLEKAT